MYDLTKKIVLITGAANGIGFGCAKAILRAGASGVAIADVNEANGQAAEKELAKEFGSDKVLFVKTDVTKQEQFEGAFQATIAKWKSLNVLINNAGICNDGKYEMEIAINATAVVRGTLLGLQYIGKDNGGKDGVIVNIASIAGVDGGMTLPVYSGTKHFVIGFSRSIGTPYYYNRTGVKIVTVCPGVTETSLIAYDGMTENRFIFPELQQICVNTLKTVQYQPVECVAEGVITTIRKGENGSVWIVEDDEHYEIVFPERRSLRK